MVFIPFAQRVVQRVEHDQSASGHHAQIACHVDRMTQQGRADTPVFLFSSEVLADGELAYQP